MIGTVIFTGTGFLAAQLGSPNLVLGIWVVGGISAFLGAICYSELGINFPSSGGEYVYLTRAFGPAWGFMTGWASFFAGFSAPIAAAALAFSEYLGHFFPALSQENAPVSSAPAWPSVSAARRSSPAGWSRFSQCSILGVQRVAHVQNVLTGVKVLVLLAFIVLGFTIGDGNAANFRQTATRDCRHPWSRSSPSAWCGSTSLTAAGTRPPMSPRIRFLPGQADAYVLLEGAFVSIQNCSKDAEDKSATRTAVAKDGSFDAAGFIPGAYCLTFEVPQGTDYKQQSYRVAATIRDRDVDQVQVKAWQ